MVKLRRLSAWGLIGMVVFLILFLLGSHAVQAQYWQALPPYNLLWPLWSPTLSPADPLTGVPTPLLNSVTRNTALPVQPVLLWDPVQRDFPYMLYNIPQPLGGGLVLFDQYFGLNPWPPSYLTNSVTGLPSPITLPVGFQSLPPTALDPLLDYVTIANLYFVAQYPPGLFATAISRLLTPAEIWGLPSL